MIEKWQIFSRCLYLRFIGHLEWLSQTRYFNLILTIANLTSSNLIIIYNTNNIFLIFLKLLFIIYRIKSWEKAEIFTHPIIISAVKSG